MLNDGMEVENMAVESQIEVLGDVCNVSILKCITFELTAVAILFNC